MRTLPFAALMLIAINAAGAQEPSARPGGTGTVAGSVVTLDQLPLNGVRVEARIGARVVARTSGREDGGFRLERLEPGTYAVIEVYENAQVHAAHMASAWVREAIPQSIALVDGTFDIRQYVSQGSAPVRLTMAG